MPEKTLSFFELFAQYRPDPAAAAVLETWSVTGAVMDRQARTIRVDLLCPEPPDGALLRQVETDLAGLYQLSAVSLRPMSPEPPLTAPRRKPWDQAVPNPEPAPGTGVAGRASPPMSDEDVPPLSEGPRRRGLRRRKKDPSPRRS